MTRILAIDPGSRLTGFGIIDVDGSQRKYVTCGTIRLPEGNLADKLRLIFQSVSHIIDEYTPHEFAIEEVFLAKNANSALKLGQARGAAIVAAANAGLDVCEYAARRVKQSVTGSGNADKSQIQAMVKLLLKLEVEPQVDAADALAIALCHASTRTALGIEYGKGKRAGRSAKRWQLSDVRNINK
ncbi:crossover junction endodeoxyribonuclease RuvC [Maribrevibacterium harenarium]|uniref:Crossover junction endodeoxyribonuclease RuvC n=1 Tax=Maribrevibacterium harenarium TaxID=2589817 RepID=A0A501X4U4_9GAMM|nr:crossover junction endodeoxyribonuclease RuvC [Maribrevibacterium harenarium]TPE55471.1 crossover junction endodeoxyribonuclease RuvC [Maribrevibacterium harenarium]